MKRSAFFVTGFVFLAVLVMPNAARAQNVDPWTALQQVLVDLKADRQAVVAANLPLTEAEARAFWPVYKDYRGEIEKLAQRVASLIAAYAANFEPMTDAKADAFFKDLLAIDRDRLTARERHRAEGPGGPARTESCTLLPDREQAVRRHRQRRARLRDPAGAGGEVTQPSS